VSSLELRAVPPIDEPFCSRIRSAFERRAGIVGHDLAIEVCRHDVVLRGVVTSWYHKQLAQETALRVDGVGAVLNELSVLAGSRRDG
jgi:osmotically-inducible protein OsmY